MAFYGKKTFHRSLLRGWKIGNVCFSLILEGECKFILLFLVFPSPVFLTCSFRCVCVYVCVCVCVWQQRGRRADRQFIQPWSLLRCQLVPSRVVIVSVLLAVVCSSLILSSVEMSLVPVLQCLSCLFSLVCRFSTLSVLLPAAMPHLISLHAATRPPCLSACLPACLSPASFISTWSHCPSACFHCTSVWTL